MYARMMYARLMYARLMYARLMYVRLMYARLMYARMMNFTGSYFDAALIKMSRSRQSASCLPDMVT